MEKNVVIVLTAVAGLLSVGLFKSVKRNIELTNRVTTLSNRLDILQSELSAERKLAYTERRINSELKSKFRELK